MKHLFILSFILFNINLFGQDTLQTSLKPDLSKQDELPENPMIDEDIDKQADEAVFKVVDEMPRFPGCEDMEGTDLEKNRCAQELMLRFIYTHLKYPPEARENGVEGMVVLQYIINTDGLIENIEIIRDPGGGLGEAGVDVIELMNAQQLRWTPGKQNGIAKQVQYTLPIKFKLESGKERRKQRRGKKN